MNPDSYLQTFDAKNPLPLAQTPRAHLWRVDTAKGPAVLKILTERGVNAGELAGAQALRLWNGSGAVCLYELKGKAMLMEWLDGPPLGDLARDGGDDEAANLIAEASLKLRRPASAGFFALKDHFEGALASAEISAFPRPYRSAFGRAQSLWHTLLETTRENCLLHGDLHHDNILQSARGWCAIDPKGIVGDPCYEFGIVFRNPVGREAQAASPERILKLADIFSRRTVLDKTRILQFGFTHVALSLAWQFSRGKLPETDLDIFQAFDELQLPLQ